MGKEKFPPLTPGEYQLAEAFLRWFHAQRPIVPETDNVGNQYTTMNVGDNADLYLLSHPAIAQRVDRDTLVGLARRYRAAIAAKTRSENALALKKRIPLLAKVRPKNVSWEQKDIIRGKNKAKKAAKKIAEKKANAAQADFKSRQGSLI